MYGLYGAIAVFSHMERNIEHGMEADIPVLSTIRYLTPI